MIDARAAKGVSVPTSVWVHSLCFWFLVAILAWAPFPLGSNREWSWGLLMLLVALCWILWTLWVWAMPEVYWQNFDRLKIPLFLAALTLSWAIFQTLPIV